MTVDDMLADMQRMATALLEDLERAKRLLMESTKLIEGYDELTTRLQETNAHLMRENGKLRLLADMKDDIARMQ